MPSFCQNGTEIWKQDIALPAFAEELVLLSILKAYLAYMQNCSPHKIKSWPPFQKKVLEGRCCRIGDTEITGLQSQMVIFSSDGAQNRVAMH